MLGQANVGSLVCPVSASIAAPRHFRARCGVVLTTFWLSWSQNSNGAYPLLGLSVRLGLAPFRALCYILFMPLADDILAILVCPVCKKPVHYLPDQSGLKCESCKRVYPVRDDIPVMLPEEATIAPE